MLQCPFCSRQYYAGPPLECSCGARAVPAHVQAHLEAIGAASSDLPVMATPEGLRLLGAGAVKLDDEHYRAMVHEVHA